MGIKGLSKWLQVKWPTAFTAKADLASAAFEAICIDINPLLHRAARKSKNNDQCVKRLFRGLDDLVIHGFNPRSVVCLAVDGPGPLAKIAEQRRRRMSPRIAKKCTFDTRQITPGTSFMNAIDSNLNYWACQYLVRTARTKPGLRVVVNGPNVAGEGEVKILGHLVEGHGSLNNLIIGSDNDILLQVIAANVKGTVVLDDDGGVTFAYDDFLSAISREFPDGKPELLALDLAVLMLLMGNDYLPKLRKVTYDQLWNSYKRAAASRRGQHLVDLAGESFDAAFMKAIIQGTGLGSSWSGPTRHEATSPLPDGAADPLAGDDMEDDVTLDANGLNPNRWEIEMTPVARRNKSKRFLEGIMWCLEMCVNRSCPDYSYEYTYFTAPAPADLLAFLDEMIGDQTKHILSWPRSTSNAVHPVICAAMLLGSEGSDFMDPSWQPLMGLEADCLESKLSELIKQPALCSAHMFDAAFGRPIEVRMTHTRNSKHYMPVLPSFATQTFRMPFFREVHPTSDHLGKRKTWADRFSTAIVTNDLAAATAPPSAQKKRKVVLTNQLKMDVDIVVPIAPPDQEQTPRIPPPMNKPAHVAMETHADFCIHCLLKKHETRLNTGFRYDRINSCGGHQVWGLRDHDSPCSQAPCMRQHQMHSKSRGRQAITRIVRCIRDHPLQIIATLKQGLAPVGAPQGLGHRHRRRETNIIIFKQQVLRTVTKIWDRIRTAGVEKRRNRGALTKRILEDHQVEICKHHICVFGQKL
ncbi:hypothetical protein HDU86_006596 [Geranomyces michiganensis]|nr:hypothetical protein HDU86_006596 [Geranomyces michiganensis]